MSIIEMNKEIQKEVLEFVNQNELNISLPLRMLDLVSEVGELSKEVLNNTNYGTEDWSNDNLGNEWEKEIGDLFFTLVCVANSSGVDLQECLQRSLDKYKKRLKENDQIGSAK